MTPRLRFLSSEQVVELHEAVLRKTGGLSGAGHRGSSYEAVDAAVQAVKNSYYLPGRPSTPGGRTSYSAATSIAWPVAALLATASVNSM